MSTQRDVEGVTIVRYCGAEDQAIPWGDGTSRIRFYIRKENGTSLDLNIRQASALASTVKELI